MLHAIPQALRTRFESLLVSRMDERNEALTERSHIQADQFPDGFSAGFGKHWLELRRLADQDGFIPLGIEIDDQYVTHISFE